MESRSDCHENPVIPPPSDLIWILEWTTLNTRISSSKRWDVSTASTNVTSFRFLKILRYFNISAAPPTTPKQLNDKYKYGLYK